MSGTPPEDERPEFELLIRSGSGGNRVIVRGELDIYTADTFREKLLHALADGEVVLDLSELRFMDSSGVAAIDAVLRDPSAGRLAVDPHLHERVRRILELTRMIEALPFAESDET